MQPTNLLRSSAVALLLGVLGLLATCSSYERVQCEKTTCPKGYSCSEDGKYCILDQCGNGVTDDDEACDDGNVKSGDGCSATCTIEWCGNGVLDKGEVCDGSHAKGDRALAVGEQCSDDCKSIWLCGNYIQDPNEVCDDGNTTDGDHCSANCLSEEWCGNEIVDTAIGEVCDEGDTNPVNLATGDNCSSDCKSKGTCGNGLRDPHEDCDDGLDGVQKDSETCDFDCSVVKCGDGWTNSAAGEECDYGASGLAACTLRCTRVKCGDGIVTLEAGEQCDDGNIVPGDGCSADCTSDETCGNGVIDEIKGEICDDGNNINGDKCSADCRSTEGCGNGIRDPLTEECDLGSCPPWTDPAICKNSNSGNCTLACQMARCGDGQKRESIGLHGEAPEVCDDGELNVAPASGNGYYGPNKCTITCERAPYCGDGIVDERFQEACDDGSNPDANCDAECKLGEKKPCESNAQCSESQRLVCDITHDHRCETKGSCGNGYVDSGEACDDGDTEDGNDCTGGCRFPLGHSCNDTKECDSTVAVCDAFEHRCENANECGNGSRESGEACDDGGTIDGDGCSHACKYEVGLPCDVDSNCSTGSCTGDPKICRCTEDFQCAAGKRCHYDPEINEHMSTISGTAGAGGGSAVGGESSGSGGGGGVGSDPGEGRDRNSAGMCHCDDNSQCPSGNCARRFDDFFEYCWPKG